MTILSRTTNVRILRDTDPAAGAMPFSGELHETAGGPLDGEIITVAQVDYIDELGGAIGPGSTIVRDAITGRPTALYNAFRCDACGRFHALCYLAKKTEPMPNPQPITPDNTTTAPIRTGICETCWRKGRPIRILKVLGRGIMAIIRFIFAPFLPDQPETAIDTVPGIIQPDPNEQNRQRNLLPQPRN